MRSDEWYKSLTDQEESAALLAENATLRERLAAAEHNVEDLLSAVDCRDKLLATAGESLQLLYDQKDDLQQREQQARAIIGALELGIFTPTTYCMEHCEELQPPSRKQHDPKCLVPQARAWLADRAEQRATTQEEVSLSYSPPLAGLEDSSPMTMEEEFGPEVRYCKMCGQPRDANGHCPCGE